MERALTISQAAEKNKVTRAALYLAIKDKRLQVHKRDGVNMIFVSELERFRKEKYSRKRSRFQGELIFDESKGTLSIDEASKHFDIPKQNLYYAVRIGKLPAKRAKAAWVLNLADVERYHEMILHGKPRNKWVYA